MTRPICIRPKLLLAAVLTGALLVPAVAEVVHAQDQRPPPETRKSQVMRPVTYKKIEPIQTLLSEDKARDALKLLQALDLEKFNDYEKGVAYQMWGYAYSSLEDYAKAIEFFEKSIATGQLSPSLELNLRFNTAQMYRALDKLPESLQRFEQWLALAESPTGTQYYQISSTYYQAERYDKALPLIEKAMATKSEPEQSWLNLAVALYLEKKDYKRALPYLEDLAVRFPKASYWKQLAAVYSELKQDKKSLATQELAYKQGFLESNTDLRRLAEMYLFLEVPYRAAALIEKEIKAGRMEKNERNWELLGTAWFQAREVDKALQPLENAAALSSNGKQHMRLAQLYVEKEEWDKALASLDKALQKGDLKSVGEAHLLRGIALFNAGKPGPARDALARARRSGDDSVTRQARQWEKHIDNKQAADSAE